MTARRAGQTRRASGWALFIAAVLALRLSGMGAQPPEVGASSADADGAAVDRHVAEATRAFSWIISSHDVSDFEQATNRCLDARALCTNDDMLDLDTTRLRLATLVTALELAAEPADPVHLDASAIEQVTAIQHAAGIAAEALAEFSSNGCGGSVDGVPVEDVPAGCAEVTHDAQRSLKEFDSAHGAWFTDEP
jgi:hypothetical protein